ncbi:hypothetical protein [Jeongeupia naejangsanensis]|uniref:Uncharacterized protein n=1 Tax=Jeongeupia naejangsanensis TaxID=613195 RepID=A0ABS2BH82_9NEIS|nr:hypothetical protein [Jeongeupia naejangsanensis]MBM3114961.1 hypothetical protein [Jeongeupia naejangsanensis]
MKKKGLLRKPKLGSTGAVERKRKEYVESWFGWRLLLSSFAVIVAPCAYIFGRAYHDGYLIEFGLSSSHFPIDVIEAYVGAFYAVLGIWKRFAIWLNIPSEFFAFLIAFLIVLAFYVLMGYLFIILKEWVDGLKFTSNSNRLRSFAGWLSPAKNRFVRSLGFVSAIGLLIFCAGYLVFAFVLIARLVPSVSFSQGEYYAKEQKASFEKGVCNERKKTLGLCVALKSGDGKLIASGAYISRNEKSIAIYADGVSKIYSIPDKYVIESY